MALADRIHVSRRYQRAIRIDTDVGNPAALEGFVCPASSAEVLETMARYVSESGQGAFTWTGPYGSGKSSLAVALSAALNGSKARRHHSASILGRRTSALLAEALPPRTRGWRILPVAGRRDCPVQVIGKAIEAAGLLSDSRPRSWTEKRVLDTLEEIAARNPRTGGGLAVLVDEMGKFLEAAVQDGSDIHLFQQLAELASRSGGRLLVVGILHQAFEEYAHRLSRHMRDEWSKIQGRFVDLAVNTVGDEQIDLLGRAIESDHRSSPPGSLAKGVARLAQKQTSPHLAEMLENCWPLHPVVACLLGPLSRQRFGQNQRSIFGFLNSAEPGGFQDFLRSANDSDLYGPDRLWDYLRINLEPAILASPDGHRWALAMDAFGRCEAMGGEDLHLRLLKVIAMVDLLKNRSGLVASPDLLMLALPSDGPKDLVAALDDLQSWSLIVFRKFAGAYAVFEGSDFDIEHALEQVSVGVRETEFSLMGATARPQPLVAKRHYHETGAFRWFDVGIVPLAEIEKLASRYTPRHGEIGIFFLVIPTKGETGEAAEKACRVAACMSSEWDIVVGLSQSTGSIPDVAAELSALERVRDETADLQGDRVARTEVLARIAAAQGQLESELARAFDSASWYRKHATAKPLVHSDLNSLASDLSDARFDSAPRLHNELLGRMKPSSNAVAAQNILLRRMVLDEGKARLGIKGFPAEGGLFASLLEAPGLYRETVDGWRFVVPEPNAQDAHNLGPTWRAAEDLLKANAHRAVPVAEIYDVWRRAPLGIKDGLLPVLAVAFLLSERKKLGFYRQGVFQARLSDLDIDYLAKDPKDVQLRWMDLTEVSRLLLSELADVVRHLDEENELSHLEPLDVARGLVAIHDRLPPWVNRTQRLSRNAKRVRQLFKQANDPNRLIFDDIPRVLNDATATGEHESMQRIASQVSKGLGELRQAYPAMLNRMRELLLAELQVPNASSSMLAELRDRAENIRGLGGDHRLQAFIVRLARFEGQDEDMESLAGMAVNKPPRNWVDPDIDRAAVELAELAQRFIHAEAFAHVKGRRDKRHAIAVVVGIEGRSTPIHDEFAIADLDRSKVRSLIERMDNMLRESGESRRNIILAALAELSARHLEAPGEAEPTATLKRRRDIS
ncbi:MAG: ATP-binding protein [Acidobacteriota bacterium]|nr:ATP-binding protein [Acidobacteriota bacterium]